MIRRLLWAVTVLSLLPAFQAQAQPAWPSQPLRIIVPFAPGAFTDVAARSVAAVLTPQLGQQVVVDNRTGAGGTIGTEMVARAAPDGYTLLLSDNSFAVSAGLYAKLPYDPVKDFIQVSAVAEAPAMLVGRLGLTAKTLKDLADLARTKSGEFTFGSGGQGSSAHLAMELFLNVAGIKMTHVPFRGAAVAMTEAVAGHIDITIASIALGMPFVRGGRVLGFAVTGKERSPMLPEVPTFAEAGFPGYQFTYWWGIAVRATTPPQIVSRLNQEIARAVDNAKLKENFVSQGARAVSSSSAEFSQQVHEEIKVWKNVIAKAGVKVE
jgi:tripartite-type tricarboxylate transporter receptor subunit TctC